MAQSDSKGVGQQIAENVKNFKKAFGSSSEPPKKDEKSFGAPSQRDWKNYKPERPVWPKQAPKKDTGKGGGK